MNIIKQFFSFSWLRSDERKELEQLRKEKEELLNEKEGLIKQGQEIQAVYENLAPEVKEAEKSFEKNLEEKKPYRSLRTIGNTVIVILWDGVPLQGDIALIDKVREAKTEQEILELFTVKPEVIAKEPTIFHEDTEEEKQLIKDNLRVLRNHPDFEIKDEKVYMKGISLEIPGIIAASFIEILEKTEAFDKSISDGEDFEEDGRMKLEEQYEALKMFWLKLAVNPIENSRNQLLAFVKKNDVRITATGNLVLYRNIVKMNGGENTELIEFVSQQYTKIKKWKKSPKNYLVIEEQERIEEEVNEPGHWEDNPEFDADEEYENDDYDVEEEIWVDNTTTTKVTVRKVLKLRKIDEEVNGEVKGNLEKLYLDLPNMQGNKYTSKRNRGKYTIKIGEVYKIEESELNTDAGVCDAGGLHAACVTWDYSSFGDTPVVVLVNPSKALTVPTYDMGKLRTTEMFVACINDKPLGEHFDDFLIHDEQYNQYTIDELEKALSTKDFSSLNIQEETTKVNEDDLSAITAALKGRIVTV